MTQLPASLFRPAFALALLTSLSFAPAEATAGGQNPLSCSQGDEIRTIDYYMDINMEELRAINENPMEESIRQELIATNTEEFLALQDHREALIVECAKEIRTRNEYWEAQGLDPDAAPAEQAPLDPQNSDETAPENGAGSASN